MVNGRFSGRFFIVPGDAAFIGRQAGIIHRPLLST